MTQEEADIGVNESYQPNSADNTAISKTLELPPASYLSYIPTSVQSSAPARFLRNLIIDDDDEVEHIEHFKYQQVLGRKLTVRSIIGLGFSIMGVPFGMSLTLWITLVDGGNVTMLYGWLVVTIFSIFVMLSLSEIISKYPTSGGVYHFSALLSNDKYSLISAWFTGWLLLIGSWTYIVSILFSGSQFILAIFGLKDSFYKENIFLVLAVYFGLLMICGFINFKFSKYLEIINRACIMWSLGTILIIDILLIFYAERTHSIKEILSSFDNTRSGWPDPLAFFVGLSGSAYTMNGYGMLLSMTDEVKNPEKNMPKGLVSSILITFINGLIFILPLLTILPEMTLLLDETPEIMPIDLIFKFAIKSYVISFLLILLLVGTVIFQGIGSITTASRATYAFARDGGLPYKDMWTTVDAIDEDTVPKNAIFLSMGVSAILPVIAIISESAFNSFMGACVITLTLSNGVPIMCLMFNKRRKVKGGAFRLGKLGWIINGLACFWVVLATLALALPPVIKGLSWHSMNYASLVTVGFLLFATVCFKWYGDRNFEGPKIDSDYFELHNAHALGLTQLQQGGLDQDDEGDDTKHSSDQRHDSFETNPFDALL